MFDFISLAIGNYNIGFMGQNWFYKFGNVAARILVIGICVDDDVGAEPQTGIQAMLEGVSQSHIFAVLDDVMNTKLPCNFGRAICAAIVNDEYLDAVNSRNGRGKFGNSGGQCFCFVIAGNLDN